MEATYRQEGATLNYTPSADISGGQVLQLPDGRAAVASVDIDSGRQGAVHVCGIYDVAKTADIVMLDGCELWWDHSANAAILRPAGGGGSDRDFFLGTCDGDAAASDTVVRCKLNERPKYIIDLTRDPFDFVPVLTAGTPSLAMVGGSARAAFSATAEAQKLDLLSKRSFPASSNWILEADIEVVTNADADVADLNVGVANATHASDADSITESCFAHLDMGADLNIDLESDDGTTEVAATDSTVDFAVGTPFSVVLDGRDHTDIQAYINGALRLGSTVFTLEDATGPLKALFHFEKSANDSPGVVMLHRLTVRLAE